ncbi:MAG: hypothetical protein HZA48_11245 [Planctomycetes bacterium]|nr:hypothetical protein [Planctomycetota bacterium]
MFQINSITRGVLFAIIIAGLSLLPACGGGGGGSTTNPPGGSDTAFVSGNVSYPSSGLTKPQTTPDGKTLLKINNSDLVNVPDADVYVYTIDDSDFSDPVAGPIKTDANGSYTIKLSDFKAGFDPNSQQQYVIRAAFTRGNGQKLGLRRLLDMNDAALDKDANGAPVVGVDPVTEIVVQTILTKIQEIFNEFGLVDINPALWASLVEIVSSIVKEVTAQLATGDLTVDESYFYDDYTSSFDTTKSGAAGSVEISTASTMLDGAAADEIFKEGVAAEKKLVALINIITMLGFTVARENSNEECYTYIEPDFFRKADGTLMELTAENFPGISNPEPITTDTAKQLSFNPNVYLINIKDVFADANSDGFVDESGVKLQDKDMFGRDFTTYTFNKDRKFRLRDIMEHMDTFSYALVEYIADNYNTLSCTLSDLKVLTKAEFEWRWNWSWDSGTNTDIFDSAAITDAEIAEMFDITLPSTSGEFVEMSLEQISNYINIADFALEFLANKAVLDGLYADTNAYYEAVFSPYMSQDGTVIDGDGFFNKAGELIYSTPMWTSMEERYKSVIYAGVSPQLYGQTFADSTVLDFRSAFVIFVMRIVGQRVIDPSAANSFGGGWMYQNPDNKQEIREYWENLKEISPIASEQVLKSIFSGLMDGFSAYAGDYENLTFNENLETILSSLQFDSWWNPENNQQFEQLPSNWQLTLTQHFKADSGPLASESMELYYDNGQDAWASTHNSTSDSANFISSVTTDANGMLTLTFDSVNNPDGLWKGYFVKFAYDYDSNGTADTFVWYFWADPFTSWMNHDGEDTDTNGDGQREDTNGNGKIDFVLHWGYDPGAVFDPANPQWPFFVGEWKPMFFPYVWLDNNTYFNFGYDIENTEFAGTAEFSGWDALVTSNSLNKLVFVPNGSNTNLKIYKLDILALDAALPVDAKKTFKNDNIYASYDAGFTIDFYASKGTLMTITTVITGDIFTATGGYDKPSIYLIRTGDALTDPADTERAYLLRVFHTEDGVGMDFEFAWVLTTTGMTSGWAFMPPDPFSTGPVTGPGPGPGPAPAGTAIATMSAQEMAVSAAFDGTNYLVAIEGNDANNNAANAQLVSATGALTGTRIFTAGAGGVPTVAYDGAYYLMVWADDATYPVDTIKGQFIKKDGTGLSGATIDIAAISSNTDELGDVAYGGGNYLVVYFKEVNSSTGESKAYGKLVSTAGIVGSEFAISTGYADFGFKCVAFDGTDFFVVWCDDTNDYEIKGRFVSPTGTLGAEISINANTYLSDNEVSVCYDSTNAKYLVIWTDEVGGLNSGEWDVYGQIVDKNGSLVGSGIVINADPGEQFLPTAASDGTDFFVVWTDLTVDGFSTTADWNVYGQYVSMSGTLVGTEVSVNTDAGMQLGTMGGYAGGKFFVILNTGMTIDMSTGGEFIGGDVFGVFIAK